MSDGFELVGVAQTGQLLPGKSRPDGTDYGTSELESIARKGADELVETRNLGAGVPGFPSFSGTATQPRMSFGRTKCYASDFAETLLKDRFAESSPTHFDTKQQVTGMSEDQMIQLAREIDLEVSLATFGLLDDVH